jgi:hypothetical protein
MISIRTISLATLFLEAILLVLPSFFGFLMSFGGIYTYLIANDNPSFSREQFATFVITLTSLFSFWLMLIFAFTNDRFYTTKIYKFMWMLAFIGAASTIVSLPLYQLTNASSFAFLSIGYLFLPTYFHLLCEFKRQSGTVCPIEVLKNFNLNS